MDKRKIDIFGFLVISIFIMVFFIDMLNIAEFFLMDFDGSYNATVAANYARYGKYAVSYPESIVYNNMITTGPTVLLPTSGLFALFGINWFTCHIVPLVYGCLTIILSWYLLKVSFSFRYSSIISALVVISIVISDRLFHIVSSSLLGETAVLFYFLLAALMFERFYKKKSNKCIMLAGLFLMISFLTKSTAIFFLFSFSGIVFIETFVTKRFSRESFLFFLLGLIIGFLFVESFKYSQLSGFESYIQWWRNEWRNMNAQSGGVSLPFIEKVKSLASITGCNYIVFVAITLIVVILYCVSVFSLNYRRKLDCIFVMNILAVCGASLVVYYVLFGQGGLSNPRRLFINVFMLKLSFMFLLFQIVFNLVKKYKSKKLNCLSLLSMIVILFFFYSFNIMKENLQNYMSKETCDNIDKISMKRLINEVAKLPENSKLYVFGWWQEPNVTLSLDRPMYDICLYNEEKAHNEKEYFIVGYLISNADLLQIEKNISAKLKVYYSDVYHNKGRNNNGNSNNIPLLYSIYEIVK